MAYSERRGRPVFRGRSYGLSDRAGGFVHIVAGSMSAFLLVFNGDASWIWSVVHFTLPVLLGNIVGGTALFGLLAYAQVMKEI